MAEEEVKEEEEKKDAGEAAGEGGDGEEGEEGAAPKKKGPKKLILILVPVLLIVLGAAGFLLFSGGGKDEPGENAEEAHAEDGHAEEAVTPAGTFAFHDLPEILVNISAAGKKSSFLKISISLEIEDETKLPEIQRLEPRIIDKFQIYLRGLSIDDLQGTQGVYRLREELLERVNATTKPIKVTQVLFKEILVQ